MSGLALSRANSRKEVVDGGIKADGTADDHQSTRHDPSTMRSVLAKGARTPPPLTQGRIPHSRCDRVRTGPRAATVYALCRFIASAAATHSGANPLQPAVDRIMHTHTRKHPCGRHIGIMQYTACCDPQSLTWQPSLTCSRAQGETLPSDRGSLSSAPRSRPPHRRYPWAGGRAGPTMADAARAPPPTPSGVATCRSDAAASSSRPQSGTSGGRCSCARRSWARSHPPRAGPT